MTATLSSPVSRTREEEPRAARETAKVEVTVARSAAELGVHVPAWQRLADRAVTPNSFYEPWMLLPAIEAFGRGLPLRFVLVHRAGSLIGFFPLQERRRLKGLPWRSLALWQHLHCFLTAPLLDRDDARAALEAFLAWTRHGQTPRIIEFPLAPGDGLFQGLMLDVVGDGRHVSFVDDAYSRACLHCDGSGEEYLEQTLSTGNRKELRRQRRRLSELGRLELRRLERGDDVDRWIDAFLALEGAGWKGAEGGAMASDPVQRAYFQSIARAGHERGRLMMLGLYLNDRPIALKCNFLCPPGAFAFKIAFDEALGRFSPGVQLELDNILVAHERRGLKWMDSCAIARHFMINRLWRERRIVQRLWLSTGGLLNDLLIAGLPWLRALRRRGQRPVANDPLQNEQSDGAQAPLSVRG